MEPKPLTNCACERNEPNRLMAHQLDTVWCSCTSSRGNVRAPHVQQAKGNTSVFDNTSGCSSTKEEKRFR